MIENLKRAAMRFGRKLTEWTATRWFAIGFLTTFLPALIGWTQEAYEVFAAGPNSGRQMPGLSTLGYAAGAAATSSLIGVAGLIVDLVAAARNRRDGGDGGNGGVELRGP